MSEGVTFDPIWEEKYEQGHRQRYPWDAVVSFMFRNAPQDKPRANVNVLEVGCGTAPNLWFAAREGFSVSGIDGSNHAIETARARFSEEGLKGDFRAGDFTRLPFDNDVFDLAIDRAALTCCGSTGMKSAIREVCRTLAPGGRFFFNPYATTHSCAKMGRPGPDDVVLDIEEGSLAGAGQIHFVSRAEIDDLFAAGWDLISVQHLEIADKLNGSDHLHTEWRVIAEKSR